MLLLPLYLVKGFYELGDSMVTSKPQILLGRQSGTVLPEQGRYAVCVSVFTMKSFKVIRNSVLVLFSGSKSCGSTVLCILLTVRKSGNRS
jgi:hypothetical protein